MLFFEKLVDMKYIFTCLITICFCFDSQAQQSIEVELTCGDSNGKEIGLSEGLGNFCYKWSPEEGLEDPHSFRTIAKPTKNTTYTLTATSEDFFQKEEVLTVDVKISIIKSIRITPLQCCWKTGDSITIDQFDIQTVPAGVILDDNHLKIDITEVPVPILSFPTDNIDVIFTYQCEGEAPIEDIITIKVVNEDFEISLNVIGGSLGKFKKIAKTLENPTADLLIPDKIKKITSKLPCELGNSISGGLDFTGGVACCIESSTCPDYSLKVEGSIGFGIGGKCEFPAPYIPVLRIELGSQIGGSLKFAAESKCKGNLCGNLEPSINFSGAIKTPKEYEDIINASGALLPTVTLPQISYCLRDGFTYEGPVCVKMDFSAKLEFASGYSLFSRGLDQDGGITINLIPKQCY